MRCLEQASVIKVDEWTKHVLAAVGGKVMQAPAEKMSNGMGRGFGWVVQAAVASEEGEDSGDSIPRALQAAQAFLQGAGSGAGGAGAP